MATSQPHPTLRESITDCNHRLDCVLRSRYGMTVHTYKVIKATTQLVGVVAMVLAMEAGMDPGTAGLIIGGIVLGPEFIEARLLDSETNTSND